MASLIQWLKFSGARGSDGLPVASGTAFFYVPGSVTQQVSAFSDDAGEVPVSQPVALDAAGRAEVYVEAPCEVAVFDAAGVRVITAGTSTDVDESMVQVASPYWTGRRGTNYATQLPTDVGTALDRIGASIGVDAMYKESANANCVQRTVHDVLHRCVSPYDYGAIGDGSADDTTPLQTAIDRAAAIGVPCYLDEGSFNISRGLTVTAASVIIGVSREKSTIVSDLETITGMTVSVGTATFVLANFSILLPYATHLGNTALLVSAGEGTVENVTTTGSNGISCTAATNVQLVGCVPTVGGTTDATARGIRLGTRCSARHCKVIGSTNADGLTRYGIELGSNATAELSYTYTCTRGFDTPSGSVRALTQTCTADNCNTGFYISGTDNGAKECLATSCTTQETEDGATRVIDERNSWTIARLALFNRAASRTGTGATNSYTDGWCSNIGASCTITEAHAGSRTVYDVIRGTISGTASADGAVVHVRLMTTTDGGTPGENPTGRGSQAVAGNGGNFCISINGFTSYTQTASTVVYYTEVRVSSGTVSLSPNEEGAYDMSTLTVEQYA